MTPQFVLVGRIVRLHDVDGEHYGYGHWCPGCNSFHPYFRTRRTARISTGPIWTFDGNEMKPTFGPSMRVYTHRTSYTDEKGVKHDFPEVTRCHYHLQKGRLNFCADSPHKLAGVQGVVLPEIETDGKMVWLLGQK